MCVCVCLCVCVCVCVCVSVMSPKSSHRAHFLLYRLFHSTKLFYLPIDAIATAAACFGNFLRAGGGVVFNVKWRRYQFMSKVQLPGSVRFDSQIKMNTGTEKKDVSLAKELKDHLEEEHRQNGVIDQGKSEKRFMERK